MAKISSERRKYVRIPSKEILKCQKYQFKKTPDNDLIQASIKDLSGGGLLFESPKKYELKDVLLLQVNVPGWDRYKSEFIKSGASSASKPLVVLAAVVRVESVNPKLFDIGVSFVGIDPGHQAALIQYIKQKAGGVVA